MSITGFQIQTMSKTYPYIRLSYIILFVFPILVYQSVIVQCVQIELCPVIYNILENKHIITSMYKTAVLLYNKIKYNI